MCSVKISSTIDEGSRKIVPLLFFHSFPIHISSNLKIAMDLGVKFSFLSVRCSIKSSIKIESRR